MAEARSTAHRRAGERSTTTVDASVTARLLALLAPYPFAFGCVFALGSSWPTRDAARFGQPGEAWSRVQLQAGGES